jgi:TolB-like protein
MFALILPILITCTTLQPIKVDNLANIIIEAHGELVSEIPDGTKLAVLDIQHNDPFVVDFITNELMKLTIKTRRTKGIKVIERDDYTLQLILKEQGFQASGFIDDREAVRIGYMLGVDMIIVGKIINNKKYHILNIRVVNVESSEVIASFNKQI